MLLYTFGISDTWYTVYIFALQFVQMLFDLMLDVSVDVVFVFFSLDV